MPNIKYSIKNFFSYRVGNITCSLDKKIRDFLTYNNDRCLIRNACISNTVGYIKNVGNGCEISFCPHNVAHIDRPEHIYADHLVDCYEQNMDLIMNRPLQLRVIREEDLQKSLKNIFDKKADVICRVCLIKNNDPASGLKLFSNRIIEEFKKNDISVLMTDCLSVDPLDFPVNSRNSNHFRLMSMGIVIIEAVPDCIVKNNVKMIMISKLFTLSKFRDADPVFINDCLLS